jgi:TRAP transporter TAXI family solute receptor
MVRRSIVMLLGALCSALCLAGAAAQSANDLRTQTKQGIIGIISGGIDGTYIRIAADLAAVLEEPGSLRILPVIGKGSVQNVADLLYLRGIDVAIVQSDVLAYVIRDKSFPGIENRLQYIAKLYNEELHVLAGPGINSIEDLAGKKVNFDVNGSGTFMTASLVFDALNIKVEPVSHDQALALEMLRKGEIGALVYVSGKPARLFANIKPEDGLHLLAVPLTPELLKNYLPSQITHDDYPFVSGSIDTVAVGAVMAAVGSFPTQSERYRNLARFTEAFFSKFNAFLGAPRHPKWREVNLAAQVPGWTRFGPAEAWLKRNAATGAPDADAELRKEFDVLLDKQEKLTGHTATPQERAAMFQQFLRWGRPQ